MPSQSDRASRWDHHVFQNKREAGVWAWLCDVADEAGVAVASRAQIAADFGLAAINVDRLIDAMSLNGMLTEERSAGAIRVCTSESIA